MLPLLRRGFIAGISFRYTSLGSSSLSVSPSHCCLQRTWKIYGRYQQLGHMNIHLNFSVNKEILYHTCGVLLVLFRKQTIHLCGLSQLTIFQKEIGQESLLPFLPSVAGQVAHLCFLIPVINYSIGSDRTLHVVHLLKCFQAGSFCAYCTSK